ncbi:gp086 [Rhodococcus phage ReqiDocB7]|uniref:gp086 n=1 Tax=Rhodococcus phage ReqiDocB7 TaxID=691966 RepID=UPI0001CDD86F|nr:gp086 [Rhodococcus phage ReqiDocB7]ADD80872.1 gp086 [Rhodococcus phage ReqiDocB7]
MKVKAITYVENIRVGEQDFENLGEFTEWAMKVALAMVETKGLRTETPMTFEADGVVTFESSGLTYRIELEAGE